MQASCKQAFTSSHPASLGRRLRSGLVRPAQQSRVCTAAVARFGGGRGGVLDRPADVDLSKRAGWDSNKDMDIGSSTITTETGRDGAGIDRQRNAPPGGGNYRLLLLDDPKHTEQLAVKAITMVVPNVDELHARNCYATSKQLGMAMIVSCLKEHAEHYRQQLFMYRLRTTIQPDNVVA